MYKSFLAICFAIALTAAFANTRILAAESTIYAVEFRTAEAFKKALKANDKSAAAGFMRYPIEREYPLPPIKSRTDFISNWDDFFDVSNTPAIVADKPVQMGGNGVMLGNGDVWFSGDKIIGINVRTKTFQKKYSEAKNREFLTINPIARGYESVAVICSTPSKSIRIQEHKDGYHYFVWKKGADLLEKPELALKGTEEFNGSGGGKRFTFKNDDYSYELNAPALCEDSCDDTLMVSKDGKELSKQVCK